MTKVFRFAPICLAALMFFSPGASAQEADPERGQGVGVVRIPEALRRGPADAFLDAALSLVETSQPTLSPSGRYLAFFRDEGDVGQQVTPLIVIDLDVAQEDPGYSRAMPLNDVDALWVDWASDDRLLVGVAFGGERSNGDLFLGGRRIFSRVLSIQRDLEGESVVLFGRESRRVTAANWRLTHVVDMLPSDPEHILMSAYRQDHLHLWRVNVLTGDAQVSDRGNRRTIGWHTQHGVAVMRLDVGLNGRQLRIIARQGEQGRWREVLRLRRRDVEERQDEFVWAGHTETPGEIYVLARPDGHEFVGIHRYDLAEGAFVGVVAERDDFDISEALIDDYSGQYVGHTYIDDRTHFDVAYGNFRPHYRALVEFFGDQMELRPIGFGGGRMLLRVDGPVELGSFYIYDSQTRHVTPLYSLQPLMNQVQLFEMEAFHIEARDGMTIPGYVTWPERGAGPDTPLVVYPHGGPELRDRVAFDPMTQFLANLGYAVYQPNYRGSWGYGRSFVEAGHGQWGLAMQDDISDGVDALIASGRVDPDRICILGFSYGAYAALAGVVREPDRYSCAIAGGGVYDLPAFLEHKSDDQGQNEYWTEWIGDPSDAETRERMLQVSPRYHADRITVPVMLYHGQRDTVTDISQTRAMAQALRDAGVRHYYFDSQQAGHDWGYSPASRRRAYFQIRMFLDDAMDGELNGSWDYEDNLGKPPAD